MGGQECPIGNPMFLAANVHDLLDFGIGFWARFFGKSVLTNILADKLAAAI